MLCYTILMISSRYHNLPGVGGYSRSFFIHHRLWQHCQHLLLRITLGQEKISKAKTRTIGSIEALLLMSEWYPRALQFPPEADGWDSDFIMTTPDIRDPPSLTADIPVSSRWREDVVEPTKRFERMSWMVLNSALALAHELGVFDSSARLPKQDDLVGLDAERYMEYLEVRRQRLPSLLFTFINSLSSRLGCTSPMPSEVGISMPETRTSLQSIDRDWLFFMSAWIELMKLTSSITDTLFPLMNMSSVGTSDTFIPVLERKQVLLANWRQRYLVNSGKSPRKEGYLDGSLTSFKKIQVQVSPTRILYSSSINISASSSTQSECKESSSESSIITHNPFRTTQSLTPLSSTKQDS